MAYKFAFLGKKKTTDLIKVMSSFLSILRIIVGTLAISIHYTRNKTLIISGMLVMLPGFINSRWGKVKG